MKLSMWTHGWCQNLTIVTKEMTNEKFGVATEPSPEVFYRGIYICAVGLDVLKFEQTSLFHSASYFNLGGGLGTLFQRGYAHQTPPPTVVTVRCGKTSACFCN